MGISLHVQKMSGSKAGMRYSNLKNRTQVYKVQYSFINPKKSSVLYAHRGNCDYFNENPGINILSGFSIASSRSRGTSLRDPVPLSIRALFLLWLDLRT
jgi:hypothetical protein